MELKDKNPKAWEAAQTIIHMRTLPPQIDYVSPSERKKCNDAEKYLNSDPELKEYLDYTEEQTDAYYTEDEGGGSPAYYDSLF